MTRDACFLFGASVYAWFVTLVLGLWAGGCGDNLIPVPDLPLPRQMTCIDFENDMVPANLHDVVVPSLEPAPLGIRIIVDASFDPFMGSSYPVPGGRMVWNVWQYHWFDGDHLGAIGRVPDREVGDLVPLGGVCRWYDPL